MFKRTAKFKRGNRSQPHIDIRFQYFQHYWRIAKSVNIDIFFDTVRMESHPYLIEKIQYQLDHNFNKSFDKFCHFFLLHPLFDTSNIIGKKAYIQRLKSDIRVLCVQRSGILEVDKPGVYRSNEARIKTLFRRLVPLVVTDYNKQLSKHLVRVLSTNQPINDDIKADIRFLVNAYLVQLYHKGYSVDYISKLNDIIFFQSHLEFPFEKRLSDFNGDKEKYEEYKNSVKFNTPLNVNLAALDTLIHAPMLQGYYVFRVAGYILDHPKTITIGDVTFYNPYKKPFIKAIDRQKWARKAFKEGEFFYSATSKAEFKRVRPSQCNAVVSLPYITHENIESNNNFYIAYHRVTQALDILNNFINPKDEETRGRGEVNIHESFKVHGNKRPARVSAMLTVERLFKIELNKVRLGDLHRRLNILKKIDTKTHLGETLLEIESIQSKLQSRDELFNFKDLWIPWESLMTRAEIKETTLNALYIDYNQGYLKRVIQFCFVHLKETEHFFTKANYYVLNDADFDEIGLKHTNGRAIITPKFKRNFRLLETKVPIEIVKDLTSKIDKFLNNRAGFEQDLKKWIGDTIDEVYVERNMEVHSNTFTDLSKVKLKENFLFMSNILFYYMIKFIDSNRPDDVQHVRDRIRAYKLSI